MVTRVGWLYGPFSANPTKPATAVPTPSIGLEPADFACDHDSGKLGTEPLAEEAAKSLRGRTLIAGGIGPDIPSGKTPAFRGKMKGMRRR